MSASQRGLSLVELMVGLAIGLVVVAAALSLLAQQMKENRSLLLDAQLMLDLRTTTDLMTRDLRRAGYWAGARDAVWQEARTQRANPHAGLHLGDTLDFSYSHGTEESAEDRGAPASDETFGYRLRKGVIEMQLGAGNWQALTDAGTLTVTSLEVTPQLTNIPLAGACSRPCTADSPHCPPLQQLRSVNLRIQARSATDATVTRTTQTLVRLRNDTVEGSCPP